MGGKEKKGRENVKIGWKKGRREQCRSTPNTFIRCGSQTIFLNVLFCLYLPDSQHLLYYTIMYIINAASVNLTRIPGSEIKFRFIL